MKYGLVHIDLRPVFAALFGEDAEFMKVDGIEDNGRTARVIFKALDENLPDGAGSTAVDDLPKYKAEFGPPTVKFTKEE